MAKKYTVLCFFHFKPHYFYLFVNFVDLMFGNFAITAINYDHKLKKIEDILVSITTVSVIMLYLIGILTFLIFLYFETYRTIFHSTYVYVRYVVTICRSIFFAMALSFYIYIIGDHPKMSLHIYFTITKLIIVLYISVNDVVWCHWLKELIIDKHPSEETKDNLIDNTHGEENNLEANSDPANNPNNNKDIKGNDVEL